MVLIARVIVDILKFNKMWDLYCCDDLKIQMFALEYKKRRDFLVNSLN